MPGDATEDQIEAIESRKNLAIAQAEEWLDAARQLANRKLPWAPPEAVAQLALIMAIEHGKSLISERLGDIKQAIEFTG